MPDAPDFFMYRLESDKGVLGDMAELAVRLGTVMKYDRSGSMIFGDSFDHGLAPYITVKSGEGAAVDVVSKTTYADGYAVRLTAGKDASHRAGIGKCLQPQVINLMGFEFSFSLETDTTRVGLICTWNTTTEIKIWSIYWYPASGVLTYLDHEGHSIQFATKNLPIGNKNLFHTIKLIIDLETVHYNRLMVDQELYDLSAYMGQTGDPDPFPSLIFAAYNTGRSGYNDIIYVDDFVITVDEIV